MRSVTEFIDHLAAGESVKYLLFWGHKPRRDGTIGASCLSQWWPAEFTVEGTTFRTAEHYMMWRKALLFEDPATAEQVVAADHPSQAKALGRKIAGFDEKRWEEHRFEIVTTASTAKFAQHGDLLTYLRGTGDRVLVEASPVDRVWGIGLAADDPAAQDPARWRGLNLLGFALMAARAALRADPRPPQTETLEPRAARDCYGDRTIRISRTALRSGGVTATHEQRNG
ncbi:NADAR family protein [Nocardia takedensis]|uniref:NADAR family protein n=1 Tax=Nocardia takedensis TaxID=259390 RepID=UPI000313AA67|nr:NADAR family protein [Nocardia takedensis]